MRQKAIRLNCSVVSVSEPQEAYCLDGAAAERARARVVQERK